MTPPRLWERDALLDRLRAELDRARGGAGRLLAVGGEAGAGKSALLAAFLDEAAGIPSVTVRSGACDAIASPRPLGALRDIARPGSDLEAALASGRPPGDVFPMLLADLRDGTGPTVLVVEDVHWADEATLDLLRYIARRIADVPALVVVTYRDDESGPTSPVRIMLGDLASSPTMQRVHVPRLSPVAVASIADEHGLDGAALYRTTGGNPFFVSEVVASASNEIPDTVRDAVLARCARLSPDGRRLLDAISVVASRVPRWLLVELDGPDLPGLDECLDAGVLVEDADGVRFRHELARRAVESALTMARRTALNRRLLDILRGRTPEVDPAWIVHHAIAAADDDVVRASGLVAAGRAAALGAHREAAALFGEVIARARALPSAELAELLARRSYECYLTDELDAALEARAEALVHWRAIGDAVRVGDSLRWLSRLNWFLARRAEAEAAADEAVAVLESEAPTRELALAYSNRAQLAMLAYDERAASDWGARAIELGEQLGDVEVVVHALNNVGAARAHTHTAGSDGWSMIERSLALALEHDLEEHVARAYTNLLAVAVELGDVEAARRYGDAGIAYCSEHDLDAWGLYMASWRARLNLETGRWDEASTDAHQVLARPTASPVSRVTALVVVGLLRARRGDSGADEALGEALSIARVSGEVQRMAPVAVAHAELAWLAGSARPPVDFLETLELARGIDEPYVLGRLVEWARRLGVDEQAWQALAERAAGVAPFRGPYEQAIATVDGDDVNAMRAAAETLRGLGASAALLRLSERLRSLGATGVRPLRATTAANPAGLTEREAGIAALVAQGLSNSDIAGQLVVSQRTVDHHVSSVLRKLGVAGRGDVAAALARSARPAS